MELLTWQKPLDNKTPSRTKGTLKGKKAGSTLRQAYDANPKQLLTEPRVRAVSCPVHPVISVTQITELFSRPVISLTNQEVLSEYYLR